MGQATSDLSGRRSSYESLEETWANTIAASKAEHRAFGSDHAPVNDLKLKFEDVCSDCPALRAQLAALGATTPSCVYGKKLLGAQANHRHRHLSIGGRHLDWHITAALTDGELSTVIDCDRTGGMDVPVFDRDGRRYDFKCMYAEDTGFYRLSGAAEYERFMVDNNVVRDVVELGKELFMEVWTFRSTAMRKGKKSVGGHPDGALGMIILFFDLADDGLSEQLFDNDSLIMEHWLMHCPKAPEGYELEQFV